MTERSEPLDAWNLTVKDAHSYFVSGEEGAQPVWVHNNCFPSAKELGKRFGGVSPEVFHREIKDAIKEDFAKEIRKLGGSNFDVGISDSGSVLLRGNKSGKILDTGVPAKTMDIAMSEGDVLGFVTVWFEGGGVSDLAKSGLLLPEFKPKFRAKGSIGKSGRASQTDTCSMQFKTLSAALDFTEKLLLSHSAKLIEFGVFYPSHPQGNWSFTSEELKRISDIGADLNITAIS